MNEHKDIPGVDAVDVALVVLKPAGVEVLAAEAVAVVRFHRRPEAADEVGEGVAVLLHGQSGELDPRRGVPVPGGFRVERFEDEFGDLVGRLSGTRARVVLGHRLRNQFRELGDGLVGGDGFGLGLGWFGRGGRSAGSGRSGGLGLRGLAAVAALGVEGGRERRQGKSEEDRRSGSAGDHCDMVTAICLAGERKMQEIDWAAC